MNNYFEELMKTPVSVYRKTYTHNTDGTKTFSTSLIENTVCHYHSIGVSLMQFADKDTVKSGYVFCLPLNSQVKIDDILTVENMSYKVIGIRNSHIKFENICEAVIYE